MRQDQRRAAARGQGGDQRVQATDAGVAEPDALLGVAVDLDDGVVHVDKCVPAGVGAGLQGRAQPGQRKQEPPGDRVELTHVPEGERAQERPERRRGVRLREEAAHPAVAQQRHVIDAVAARDHPGHQRGHLQPGVRALVRRHTQMLIGQTAQPRPVRQRQDRHQPGGRHEIRVVERHGRAGEGVREFHLRDAPCARRN